VAQKLASSDLLDQLMRRLNAHIFMDEKSVEPYGELFVQGTLLDVLECKRAILFGFDEFQR
jgi:hypothetical protein